MQVLQPPACRNTLGLGFSAFARHYLRNHYYFLFLRVLRCFSSPGLPPLRDIPPCGRMGCPIRISADRKLFAPPRSFSQLVTSFFASESPGIHHTPFTISSYLILLYFYTFPIYPVLQPDIQVSRFSSFFIFPACQRSLSLTLLSQGECHGLKSM